MDRKQLKKSKRIVVKIGTSTLTHNTGKLNLQRIDKLARVVSDIANSSKDVVIVSSGAIAVGMSKLFMEDLPKKIGEKQALAAVGQSELMHIFSKSFAEYGYIVGQILLTKDVVEDTISKKNVINTFENLINKKVIPIVNENDSVSVDEIEYGTKKIFGDNDTLSAIVAVIVKADLLIILSDINGLYDDDPRINTNAKIISFVDEITPEIEKSAGGAGTKRGTGGMTTKINAAKIATKDGINLVIANGEDPSILYDIINGENVGTLFVKQKK